MEISEKKLKICYIITLPDLGGAQTYVKIILENSARYNIEPVLMTGREGWLTEQSRQLGIKTVIIKDMVREISPLRDIKAAWVIYNQLKKIKPDLVHCNSSKAGIVGRFAASLAGVPAIFTAHGWAFTDGVESKKRYLYRTIENIAGYMTKQIICVSDYDRQLGIRKLPAHAKKMVTIHNAITDDAPVRDWEKHPLGKKINCIVVARFSPQKRNIKLLYLLRQMLDMNMNVTMTFIGDGPDLSHAKTEAAKLNLHNAVIFRGARSDVPQLLPRYDVFVLLSNWEGFPISILEAMRAALPVIASDVGGVKEAVEEGKSGWLIDENEKKFIEVFQRIISNDISLSKSGNEGRILYKNRFTTARMMDRIVQIYLENARTM